MYRTHTCGELRLSDAGSNVTLSGWAFRIRIFGGMVFIDLRDRYGITQLVFDEAENSQLADDAKNIGREFVLKINGIVRERSNKNKDIPTGEVEILVENLEILNKSETPPFTLESDSDGGDELRMKYRYLDLRRDPVKKNILLRHQVAQEVRTFLNSENFLEIETPFLIKSTPEGARDFIVPSRMNEGTFYALPQSPQTFKQLLMVAGYDRYYQIVRCFRDEDLRADRQPEFTQIDCELAFVERDDVLKVFENLIKQIFRKVKNVEIENIERITYADAISKYGSDKPDLRFGMQIVDLSDIAKHKEFVVFNNSELVCGIKVEGAASFTRKQIDSFTDFVKRPQIGATGLVWARYENDGNLKSSVDKFYDTADLQSWMNKFDAKPGDLILILAGNKNKTLKAAGELRLHVAELLGLRNPNNYHVSWVVDFPMFEWDEESNRFYAMHHPFTSPIAEDFEKLNTEPANVRANAYDLVVNGVEVGGGSIRIFDRELQQKVFGLLGFSKEEAESQFGFLLNAFRYGAPPHGGIAFGFDRLVALLGGSETIRDYIAFPKNNQGRDIMLDAPSAVSPEQLKELGINLI